MTCKKEREVENLDDEAKDKPEANGRHMLEKDVTYH